jgi:hypothetical protein
VHGVIDVLEELAKSVQQITFRDNNVDREADIEFALDVVELSRDPSGSFLIRLGGSLIRLSAE